MTNETVGVDYWVDAPSLSLSKWSYGAIVAAELEIFSGSLKSGSSGRVYKARRLDTGDETAISSSADLVSLPPADYRLIATGEGSSVEATFDFSVFCNLNDNFDDKVTFTLNGVGAAPIENFPMLVRVSEELLPGFKYARASSGGSPVIAFGDADGANLHYDVDTWNEGGESLIWVNVPVATNGASVTMYWALKSAGVAPGNSSAKVWADYAGVWHMDDASDASSNSALGEFHDGAVQRDDGMFGGTWGRTVTGVQGPIAAMPRSDAMDALTDDAFTVSGWVRLNSATGNNYPYLFSRKDVNATEAWGVQIDGNGNNSSTRFWVDGTSRTALAYSATYRANEWVHVAYVYGKNYVQMFFDGADLGTKSVTVPTASGDLDFYIGGARADDNGSPGGRTNTLNGDMDEVRLYKGAFSAQRAAAEYANAVFADYKSAVEGDGTSFLVPSLVATNGVTVDYWVAQPSMAKTFWIAGSVSGGDLALDFGMLRSGGSVTCKAVNIDTGAETAVATGDDVAALPAGSYRLVCDSADTDVAAAELHVDLRERVLEAVLQDDESVVESDDPSNQRHECDNYDSDDYQRVHLLSFPPLGMLLELYQISPAFCAENLERLRGEAHSESSRHRHQRTLLRARRKSRRRLRRAHAAERRRGEASEPFEALAQRACESIALDLVEATDAHLRRIGPERRAHRAYDRNAALSRAEDKLRLARNGIYRVHDEVEFPHLPDGREVLEARGRGIHPAFRVDREKSLPHRLHLRSADGERSRRTLPVHVRSRDQVVVHQRDRAESRAHERLRAPASDAAHSNHEDAGARKARESVRAEKRRGADEESVRGRCAAPSAHGFR